MTGIPGDQIDLSNITLGKKIDISKLMNGQIGKEAVCVGIQYDLLTPKGLMRVGSSVGKCKEIIDEIDRVQKEEQKRKDERT